MSTAFADPAKYDLYDCKQLETERKKLADRAATLQGLMAKAETGVGGSVVAELAYRNEYIAVRGQSQFAEEAWQRNKCRSSPPVADAPALAPMPSKNAKAAPASRIVGQRGLLRPPARAVSRPPVVDPVLPRQHALRSHRTDERGRAPARPRRSDDRSCRSAARCAARGRRARGAAGRSASAPPGCRRCSRFRRGIWPAPRHPRSPCRRLARRTAAWRGRHRPAARSRRRSIRTPSGTVNSAHLRQSSTAPIIMRAGPGQFARCKRVLDFACVAGRAPARPVPGRRARRRRR